MHLRDFFDDLLRINAAPESLVSEDLTADGMKPNRNAATGMPAERATADRKHPDAESATRKQGTQREPGDREQSNAQPSDGNQPIGKPAKCKPSASHATDGEDAARSSTKSKETMCLANLARFRIATAHDVQQWQATEHAL